MYKITITSPDGKESLIGINDEQLEKLAKIDGGVSDRNDATDSSHPHFCEWLVFRLVRQFTTEHRKFKEKHGNPPVAPYQV